MIYSMTGYAVASAEQPFGTLNLELRSVNHRYLDIQLRIPDDLRALESSMRDMTTVRISRGKVEVRLAVAKSLASPAGLQIDEQLLAQLGQLDERVRAALPEAQALSVNDVLRWPGLLGSDNLEPEKLQETCNALMSRAL